MTDDFLFIVRRRHEPGPVFVITSFPNDNNLVDRDVAAFPIIVAHVKHAHFHLQHFTTQARATAAVNIELLAYKP